MEDQRKINCIVCGKEIVAIRKTRKTCSSTCRGKIRDAQKVKDWYLKQRRGELAEATKFKDKVRYWEKKEADPNYFPAKKKREYEKRKSKYQEYNRLWNVENKERVKIKKDIYRASEHGRLKSQKDCRNRRARLKEVEHNWTEEEWKIKLEQTKGYCPACNRFVGILKLSLDHTPPISKAPEGFVYTINEVSPLCVSCNSKKHNKIGEEVEGGD